MIIETSANEFYRVRPCLYAGHVWLGVVVKRVPSPLAGTVAYAPKKGAREMLVRKAGARIVQN